VTVGAVMVAALLSGVFPALPSQPETLRVRRHLERGEAPVPFHPRDVEVGDATVSYANVEFTSVGEYMVWFEQTTDGSGRGTVWHCRVDPLSGELIPWDGKGFRAFDSYLWARANPGRDARGPYYVGADRQGRLVRVRPTGATSGELEVLSAAADLLRRAIYPADLPQREHGLLYWIVNEAVPGGGYDTQNRNHWFELRFMDLAQPTVEYTIERQARPALGFAPMDFGFARFVRGEEAITYGARDACGRVLVREFLIPSGVSRDVTDTNHSHVDPYGFRLGEHHLLLTGLDGTATSMLYTRRADQRWFVPTESITPPASSLLDPALAQSHEPIHFSGQLFTTYQVNERGAGFYETALGQPGEIWLATLRVRPQRQWRLSVPQGLAVAEPEPFLGDGRVWVFYSAAQPGQTPTRTRWALRRCDTPLAR